MNNLDLILEIIDKFGVNDTVVISSVEYIALCDDYPIEIIVANPNKKIESDIFSALGFTFDSSYLNEKNSMYGLPTPKRYRKGNVSFVVNYRLGYPSNVGDYLVPLTRDVEDLLYLDAKKEGYNFFVIAEKNEMLHLVCQLVFVGELTHDKNMDRLQYLIKSINRNDFHTIACEVFFKATDEVLEYMYSYDFNPMKLKEVFIKSKEY